MRIDNACEISADFGPAELIKVLDQAGFDAAVCEALAFPILDYGGVIVVVYDMQGFLEAIKGYESRILPRIVINPNRAGHLEKMDEAIKLGAVQLKLMPTRDYYQIDDPYLVHPLVEKAVKASPSLPIDIHTGTHLCLPIQVEPLADRFPDAKIIMEHMGARHFEPDWGIKQAIRAAKKYDNIYLDIVECFNRIPSIKKAVKEIGADRMIYGSDTPLVFSDLHVRTLERLGLTEEELENILGGTLTRVFKECGRKL